MIWAWLINSTSVFITAKVLSGVEIKNFWTSLWVAAGISLANFLLGPILKFFALLNNSNFWIIRYCDKYFISDAS